MMNIKDFSSGEPAFLAPESSAPQPGPNPEPQKELSDAEITRLVDQQMGKVGASKPESGSTLIAFAFGATLIAFLYVGILAFGRLQPVEAARGASRPTAIDTPAATPKWVDWTYSLEEGQARARKNHSKVFIGFYTDWCPSCKWVDSAVYTRPDVLAESQNVAMVKINAEGRPDLAKKYNITVYPSFVWTDENGNLTARQDGSTNSAAFAPLMAQNR